MEITTQKKTKLQVERCWRLRKLRSNDNVYGKDLRIFLNEKRAARDKVKLKDDTNKVTLKDDTNNVKLKDDTKPSELNIEAILFDMFYMIFAYLKTKDLYAVSMVCKSWEHVAYRELSRRKIPFPKSIVLPGSLNNERERNSSQDKYCLIERYRSYAQYKKKVGFSPVAGIIFKNYLQSDNAVIDHHRHWIGRNDNKNFLDISSVVISGWLVYMDDQNLAFNYNEVAATLMPSMPGLNINIFCPNLAIDLPEIIIDDLLPINVNHCCLMLFYTIQSSQKNSRILEILQKRYRTGYFTLWGGYFPEISLGPYYRTTDFLCISLHGSSIKSWSIVLNLDLPDLTIEQKLLDFKNKVRLQIQSIAYSIAPAAYKTDENINKILIFKEIFPEIPLISVLFIRDDQCSLGVNSTDDVYKPELAHENSISFLIISCK